MVVHFALGNVKYDLVRAQMEMTNFSMNYSTWSGDYPADFDVRDSQLLKTMMLITGNSIQQFRKYVGCAV